MDYSKSETQLNELSPETVKVAKAGASTLSFTALKHLT